MNTSAIKPQIKLVVAKASRALRGAELVQCDPSSAVWMYAAATLYKSFQQLVQSHNRNSKT